MLVENKTIPDNRLLEGTNSFEEVKLYFRDTKVIKESMEALKEKLNIAIFRFNAKLSAIKIIRQEGTNDLYEVMRDVQRFVVKAVTTVTNIDNSVTRLSRASMQS